MSETIFDGHNLFRIFYTWRSLKQPGTNTFLLECTEYLREGSSPGCWAAAGWPIPGSLEEAPTGARPEHTHNGFPSLNLFSNYSCNQRLGSLSTVCIVCLWEWPHPHGCWGLLGSWLLMRSLGPLCRGKKLICRALWAPVDISVHKSINQSTVHFHLKSMSQRKIHRKHKSFVWRNAPKLYVGDGCYCVFLSVQSMLSNEHIVSVNVWFLIKRKWHMASSLRNDCPKCHGNHSSVMEMKLRSLLLFLLSKVCVCEGQKDCITGVLGRVPTLVCVFDVATQRAMHACL